MAPIFFCSGRHCSPTHAGPIHHPSTFQSVLARRSENDGAIIGAVFGAVFLLVIIGVVAYLVARSKTSGKKGDKSDKKKKEKEKEKKKESDKKKQNCCGEAGTSATRPTACVPAVSLTHGAARGWPAEVVYVAGDGEMDAPQMAYSDDEIQVGCGRRGCTTCSTARHMPGRPTCCDTRAGCRTPRRMSHG
jgi:hypothetical protein